MTEPKSEKKIQHEVLLAVNRKYKNRVRLWRNNVGKGFGAWVVMKVMRLLQAGNSEQALQELKQSRPVMFGVNGSPDLQGFIQIYGLAVYLGIEIKDHKGRQSDLQKNFEKMVNQFGGIYILARTVEGALEKLEHELQEINNRVGSHGFR